MRKHKDCNSHRSQKDSIAGKYNLPVMVKDAPDMSQLYHIRRMDGWIRKTVKGGSNEAI